MVLLHIQISSVYKLSAFIVRFVRNVDGEPVSNKYGTQYSYSQSSFNLFVGNNTNNRKFAVNSVKSSGYNLYNFVDLCIAE